MAKTKLKEKVPVNASGLLERIAFLKRRLELILSVSRQTYRTENDRIATIEHEAEHCLGCSKKW